MAFDGMNMSLGNLYRLGNTRTRMVTAENVFGRKGAGGMAEVSPTPQPDVVKLGQKWDGPNGCAERLGQGWKVRPCITLPAGQVTTIMDIAGPGCIQHIWITLNQKNYRNVILRMYWDDETEPSVVSPVGDFFCCGWQKAVQVNAIPINANATGGMNSYWPMPYSSRARITMENRGRKDLGGIFYAITYAEGAIEDDAARFHAQFRRTNPVTQGQDYTLLDGVTGRGQYVGTYMAWQQNNSGWWGEGEIKFFLDGDTEFPTLCGTGTEDYFGGAWCFGYNYSAPYLGYPLGESDGKPGGRHGLYRFHVLDPIRFEKDLRVTMQAIGWRDGEKYLPLQDDIASVAYWYQTEPHGAYPEMGNDENMEVI